MRLASAQACPAPGRDSWPRQRLDVVGLQRLGQVAPFDLMDRAALDELCRHTRVSHHTEATALFEARAPATALYVVLRGKAVLHGPDGVIVDGVAAPAILGAADLFNSRHVFAARAMTGSVVARIERGAMLAALQADGRLANAFLGLVAAASQVLADALLAQRCLTGVQRLAAFLLDQADAAGADNTFALDIPKKAIAGQLGMTPAHFARSLTRLASAGVERQQRNAIILNDISALRRLLEGDLAVATQDGSTAQHKQRAAYMTFRSCS